MSVQLQDHPASPLTPSPEGRWRLPLAFALTALVFLALDAVWLSTAASRLYQPAIGHLMAAEVDWLAAAIFYPGYIAGLVYFAVHPALATGRPVVALGRGALLGLFAYGTYDLTNQATLQGWPWLVTAVDLVWGATVSGVSGGAAAALTAKLARGSRRDATH